MVFAFPEWKNVKPADAHDGMEPLARNGIEARKQTAHNGQTLGAVCRAPYWNALLSISLLPATYGAPHNIKTGCTEFGNASL